MSCPRWQEFYIVPEEVAGEDWPLRVPVKVSIESKPWNGHYLLSILAPDFFAELVGRFRDILGEGGKASVRVAVQFVGACFGEGFGWRGLRILMLPRATQNPPFPTLIHQKMVAFLQTLDNPALF